LHVGERDRAVARRRARRRGDEVQLALDQLRDARGAEVAVALARLNSDPLKVVYVSTTRDKGARRGRASISLAPEEAILKDTAAAAARYDVDVRTALRANTAPEEAILQEIASSGADLVVLGVDRIREKR